MKFNLLFMSKIYDINEKFNTKTTNKTHLNSKQEFL